MAEALVAVATFSRPADAELARGRLEAEGLRAFVADAHVVRMNWLLSQAVGGVKLMVPASEEAMAMAILNEGSSGASDALHEVFPDVETERCPRCGSEEVRGQ